MSNIQRIPFHGADVLVVDVDGKPHILLRPAIEHIGLDYSRQLKKLKARSWATIGWASAVGVNGKTYQMVTVDIPTFVMLLGAIDEGRVSEQARATIVAYQAEVCDAISSLQGWEDSPGVLPPERAVLDLKELQRRHEGYVYVLEFSSGVVKVGRTKRLEKRLGQHAQAAQVQRQRVQRSWVSPRHADYADSEQKLIDFCAGRWSLTSGSEYFADADYDEIAQFASILTRAPAASVETRGFVQPGLSAVGPAVTQLQIDGDPS